MSSAPVQRDLTTKTQAAVRRRAPAAQAGARGVTVAAANAGVTGSSDDWVVIEPEADIAPKDHPYLSFDPDGTY